MSLLAPLFLALLALAAVVVLLHVQRRRTVTVPSIEIWRRLQNAGAERQRRFEWPTPNLLMLLQIAAVALIALALAQPLLGARGPDHLVVLLDTSPAMGAQARDGTRLDAARSAALEAIEAANAGRVSLVSADADPEVLVARQSRTPESLAPFLSPLLAGGGAPDWRDTGGLASGLVHAEETTRIVWVSSTAVPEALQAGIGGVEIEPIIVGTGAGNGSLALDLVAGADGEPWTLVGEARLHGALDQSTLTVSYAPRAGGEPLVWTTRELGRPAERPGDAPMRTQAIDIDLDLPGPGVVTATLTPDAGPFDDRAWFIADPAPAGLEILYVGPGGQPLLRALQSIEGVSIFQSAGLPQDVSRFALVVVDGVEVSRRPETSTLWIGAARLAGTPAPEPVTIDGPTNWQSGHPLSRGIAWSGLGVGEALAIATPPNGETLLEADGTPLLVVAPATGRRDIHLAFDPAGTAWPDAASFPVFARNLVGWLGPMPGPVPAQQCRVGQPCPVDMRLAGGSATLLEGGPAREADAAPLTVSLAGGSFVPRWPGLYSLADGERSVRIAVGADPSVSGDLAIAEPADAAPFAGRSTPLWPWLAGLALLILLVEGILAGRGPERFLKRTGLASANPLAGRRRALLGLRLASVVLVALALFDVPLPAPTRGENVVLVTPPALADATGETAAGLIASGAEEIGAPLSERRLAIVSRGPAAAVGSDLGTPPAAPATSGFSGADADALRVAAALVPEDEPGRIVLAADAALSGHDFGGATEALAARGIAVDIVPAAAPSAGEALVQELEAPYPVYAGDSFALTGRIYAQSATTVEISVLRDDEVLAAQDVELQAGHNRIETLIGDLEPGSALFEIRLAAEGDGLVENNRNGLWVDARAPGTVAVITPQTQQGEAFAEALAAQGFDARVIAPDRAPYTLRDWLQYQGVALLNVPAIALTTRQQELLETAVSEHGLGLMILGGANSFGPGGYLETTLESLSPLSSRVPREAPEVALVFVLDRSGSMQQMVGDVTRLDVAKRATLAAIDLLNEQSRAGIVVFDSEAQTVLPLQTVGDAVGAEAALARIDTGGGTSIYPGLQQAFSMLVDVEAPARHVIVMTDGLSQPGDFPGLIAEMRAEGITVSAVAVGRGAELGTVESIALAGGGAFHASNDFEALPSILSQEAMLLSGSPVEEITTTPIWVGRGESFLTGLPSQMPPIEGFVLTTPKPEANVSLVTPDAENELMPLLASWRYGNGHVLALATEASGEWTRAWQDLPDYPRLWSQAMRQFLPGTSGPGLHLTTRREADAVLISLEAVAPDGSPRTGLSLRANASGPGGDTDLALGEASPGHYEGRFIPTAIGDYAVSVAEGEENATTRVHIAYPARYDFSRDTDALVQLAAATGGRVLAPGDPLFAGVEPRWVARAGWPVWLLAALGLFMIDLMMRYAGLYARIAGVFRRRPRRAPLQSRTAPDPA